MGFTTSAAQQALAECAWDVNKALDHLFTSGPPTADTDSATQAVLGGATANSKKKKKPANSGRVWVASSASASTSASSCGSTPRPAANSRQQLSPQQALSSNASASSLLIQPDFEPV